MVESAMIKNTHFRAGLFTSALLFTTALATAGFAEEYQSLPDLSPGEIAQDVKQEFNNRTGRTEFIAPTYDPFEEDRAMAGSVSLRSVSSPVTAIDGEVLTDGVILDLGFYYNSQSNDPYDVRGFTDAAFLSGSLAPTLLRDNRVLECSRNVQNVIYDYNDYYAPTFSLNIFRPSRYYSGYHRYGRFSRPYWRNRGYGSGQYGGWSRGRYDGYRGRHDNRRDGWNGGRDRDGDHSGRDRDHGSSGNGDQGRNRRADLSGQVIRSDLSGRSRVTVDQGPVRAENRRDRSDGNDGRNHRRSSIERETGNRNTPRNSRREITTNTVTRAVPALSIRREKHPEAQSSGITSNRGRIKNPPPRQEVRSVPSRPTVKVPNVATSQVSPPRATPTRSAPPKRRSAPKRSVPKRVTPHTIKNSAPVQSKSSLKGRAVLNFFPTGNSYSREVVQSVDVDCAREETLSVFIPAGRLDAARYDGLTILALDGTGQEYPIFIPPNYIEGFQQAMGGRYNARSNVTISNPNPVYRSSEPLRDITPADCPAGTVAQGNGTCLIDETNRYPQ